MKRLNRLHRDERGMSFVFVGMGFMAFLAATTLAIDVGMFMTARTQAQTSADAGALAGALALGFDNYDDRSSTGPAVQNAIMAAHKNQVMSADVDADPPDVTFPVGPTGLSNRVRISVFRTNAPGRDNPVTTLMGQYFGLATVNISATATAEASQANAMTCVKPFTIPDKWIEMQTPPWDENDTFEVVDNRGRPLPNPDVYIPATETNYTGYDSFDDRGRQLMIRAGTGNNIMPSFYYSYSMGGVTGSDEYGWNIENCNTTMMGWGDLLLMEPGNMVGKTVEGIDNLIAKDPNAWYNTSTKKVVSTINPSPRVAAIPVYDPVYYDTGKQNGRTADLKVANYIGFFIDRREGNDVYGYITPIAGIYKGNGGPAPINAFPMAIRLVE
jgi:hypothetical protein